MEPASADADKTSSSLQKHPFYQKCHDVVQTLRLTPGAKKTTWGPSWPHGWRYSTDAYGKLLATGVMHAVETTLDVRHAALLAPDGNLFLALYWA